MAVDSSAVKDALQLSFIFFSFYKDVTCKLYTVMV